MDLITAMAVLTLSWIAINVESSNVSNMAFSFVPLIIGIFIFQEGLTINGTVLTAVNQPMNLVLITFLTLGSLWSFYLGITRVRNG